MIRAKIVLWFVLMMSILILWGCGGSVPVEEPVMVAESQEIEEEEEGDAMENSESEDVIEETAPQACTTHTDCSDGEQCIDLVCGTLSELYDTADCEATCRFTEVTIGTNDGKTHDLVAGKGSYTAAGALQWKIESGPKHCEGQTRVPIEITKYNYGEKINQEFITLAKGETSRVLDHPTITTVAFTLKVENITVQCP